MPKEKKPKKPGRRRKPVNLQCGNISKSKKREMRAPNLKKGPEISSFHSSASSSGSLGVEQRSNQFIQDLEDQVMHLTQQNEVLEDQVMHVAHRNEQLEDKIVYLTQQNEELNQRVNHLMAEVAKLSDENDHLKDTIEALSGRRSLVKLMRAQELLENCRVLLRKAKRNLKVLKRRKHETVQSLRAQISSLKLQVQKQEVQLSDYMKRDPNLQEDYLFARNCNILAVLDTKNISMSSYHELRYALDNQDVPPASTITELKKTFNKRINSSLRIVSSSSGSFCLLSNIIEFVKEHFKTMDVMEKHHSSFKSIASGDARSITLTGDGRAHGRKRGSTVIAVQICGLTFTLAVLNCAEKSLAEHLEPVIADMKRLKNEFSYSFKLCADWKFLQLTTGLAAVNSKHYCIWCTLSKDEIMLETGQIPIDNERLNIGKPGIVRPNLFADLICASDIHIDTLHLFLRITDRLFRLLIDEIITDHTDAETQRRMKMVEDKIRKIIPSFSTFRSKDDSSTWKWSSLQGPDKRILFNSIDFAEWTDLISAEKLEFISSSWKVFSEIYSILCSQITETNLAQLEILIKQFRDFFEDTEFEEEVQQVIEEDISTDASGSNLEDEIVEKLIDDTGEPLEEGASFSYGAVSITPYVHALTSHVLEMARNSLGSVMDNMQKLEARNQGHTAFFFAASSRRYSSAAQEMLLHDYRLLVNHVESRHNFLCNRCKRGFVYQKRFIQHRCQHQ
eukprot:TRINITY_DN14835_c0_g1_i11.p1 TRINITY_DN14835_c0_g1~~TRINITY_DN14835_c0_g1_i11.p1  ORF type:complete len:734 (+),score=169.66 TRINITY_DN14835_c0_g1_i11:473-2674(+)